MSEGQRAGSVRAVITGVGAVSGFGRGADVLWAALVDGRRAMKEQPFLADPVRLGGEVRRALSVNVQEQRILHHLSWK